MKKTRRQFLKYALLIGGIVLLAGAVINLSLLRQSATLGQRIAELEARRKIPDSENAAVIYERLFMDINFTEPFKDSIYIDMTGKQYAYKPWKSEDYPEAAEWIKNQQDIIDELLKASKIEKCYFPLTSDANEILLKMNRMRLFRQRAYLMVFALNNDAADGRLDDAIEKARCMLKMSEHIRQQSMFVDYLTGNAIEALTLMNLKRVIIETNISEGQLKRIEDLPVQIKEAWNEQVTAELVDYEKFRTQKDLETWPLLDRMRWLFEQGSYEKSMMENIHKLYLRLLTDRRGNRILIGLRRFKNQNGQWPESLEQIKSIVDPNALIDPQNGSSFVYQKSEDSFTLYSRGANNIDEGGNRKAPADDWMIWP